MTASALPSHLQALVSGENGAVLARLLGIDDQRVFDCRSQADLDQLVAERITADRELLRSCFPPPPAVSQDKTCVAADLGSAPSDSSHVMHFLCGCLPGSAGLGDLLLSRVDDDTPLTSDTQAKHSIDLANLSLLFGPGQLCQRAVNTARLLKFVSSVAYAIQRYAGTLELAMKLPDEFTVPEDTSLAFGSAGDREAHVGCRLE